MGRKDDGDRARSGSGSAPKRSKLGAASRAAKLARIAVYSPCADCSCNGWKAPPHHSSPSSDGANPTHEPAALCRGCSHTLGKVAYHRKLVSSDYLAIHTSNVPNFGHLFALFAFADRKKSAVQKTSYAKDVAYSAHTHKLTAF